MTLSQINSLIDSKVVSIQYSKDEACLPQILFDNSLSFIFSGEIDDIDGCIIVVYSFTFEGLNYTYDPETECYYNIQDDQTPIDTPNGDEAIELKEMADQIKNFIDNQMTFEERVRLLEEVIENVNQ
ncbi:hypothetical protein [Planktothrix mougeotii]|uniref:Uncharacterized protein n=1 Tax=Planktothrix mougeotii LEGE 06226 TaxID=1828728 RepID=A0ABR9UCA8_9CYAN|nr:hypothetical protein [Planktothrix mougeotii]MBE9144057.1 hypothetical protein [Planktothrix mougeotii LEGE 06226]